MVLRNFSIRDRNFSLHVYFFKVAFVRICLLKNCVCFRLSKDILMCNFIINIDFVKITFIETKKMPKKGYFLQECSD